MSDGDPASAEAHVAGQGNPRYANGHRRRAIRARVLATYDTCALCGRPVDRTLRLGPDGKPHPLSPEVDEIVPVSRGGDPLAWENVQLTHRICNQRKGDGTSRVERDSLDRSVRIAVIEASDCW